MNENQNKLNAAQIEILNGVVAGARRSIEAMKEMLGRPIIDGTPYLVLMTDPSGCERVYGEWPDNDGSGRKSRGWIGRDAVPNDLCGSIQCSDESARAKVTAIGPKARYMHWRTFIEERIGRMSTSVWEIEVAIARSEA